MVEVIKKFQTETWLVEGGQLHFLTSRKGLHQVVSEAATSGAKAISYLNNRPLLQPFTAPLWLKKEFVNASCSSSFTGHISFRQSQREKNFDLQKNFVLLDRIQSSFNLVPINSTTKMLYKTTT